MAERVSAAPLLRTVTCAFRTTAPVGSVTVPVNAPVDADCARTSNELNTTRRQATTVWAGLQVSCAGRAIGGTNNTSACAGRPIISIVFLRAQQGKPRSSARY